MRIRKLPPPLTRQSRGRLKVPPLIEVGSKAFMLGLSAPLSSPELSEWYVEQIIQLNHFKR